jgi:hypothetical protein
MKNSSDTIQNRTRNLPTRSSVPLPAASPHVPNKLVEVEVTVLTYLQDYTASYHLIFNPTYIYTHKV